MTDNTINHKELFSMLAACEADFLMTYDFSQEIVGLVHEHEFHAVMVMMKNTHQHRPLNNGRAPPAVPATRPRSTDD